MNFMNKTNPIGFFDSGIGGLTVVKEVISKLPNENIVYFGDTARVPYGSKSNSTVIEYTLEAAHFLMKKNIKLLVVACNTASSVALEELRKNINVPIVGMIEPGAKMALETTGNKNVGVIGTLSTINNKAYSNELKRLDATINVVEKACPLFVPLAEEGWIDHPATTLIAEEYLSGFKKKNIDTLILGCTHYPVLAGVIQKVLGDEVKLIHSGVPSAKIVEDYLNGRGIRQISNQLGRYEFYVSDVPAKFKEIAERFLGRPVEHLHKIDLEELIAQ